LVGVWNSAGVRRIPRRTGKRWSGAGAWGDKAFKAELRRRGWTETELERRRKGDMEKVGIAWRLRQGTTMTLKWIAGCLRMGTWTYVSNCLVQRRR